MTKQEFQDLIREITLLDGRVYIEIPLHCFDRFPVKKSDLTEEQIENLYQYREYCTNLPHYDTVRNGAMLETKYANVIKSFRKDGKLHIEDLPAVIKALKALEA